MKYREAARKLEALGCQELPRQVEVLIASGLIPTHSKLPYYQIGEVGISNLERFALQFAS